MEQSKVAFAVMTGSAEQATKMLQDFRELDVQSPINFADFARAGKTMLQFGVSSDAIRPTLDRLSAVSLGNSERFQSLALAFGQVQANGRLMGQEVLQMVNAGFNPLQEISRTTGISMVELRKRMEDGAISAQMVAKAFETATSEGGRFAGMNQQLEATMAGQFAKLDSEIKSASITLGNSMLPLVRELTGLLRDFAAGANAEEKTLGGFIGFGAKTISEGYGLIVATLRGKGGEYLDSLDDLKEAELDAAAEAMRTSQQKADAKAKENEQAKQMAMEAAQRAQAEKTRLAELEKTIELNKQVGQSMWSLRDEFDKLTLGEQAATEAKQRHQKWTENDIAMYRKLKDQVEQARKAKEMEAEASKLKDDLQTPQEKLGKELQRLDALKAMGPDKGINQQQLDALSMRAAERFSVKEDIAKNIAPAIKAGTKEAYQFLQRENVQAKEKAEQKKMQEELLKEAREANRLAKESPAIRFAR
jgi:tape measure domain-containing protein